MRERKRERERETETERERDTEREREREKEGGGGGESNKQAVTLSDASYTVSAIVGGFTWPKTNCERIDRSC